MNRKGQAFFIGLMMSMSLLIVLLQFIPVIKTEVDTARGSGGLDCTNSSISTGASIGCVVLDTTLWYFFGTGLAVIAGLLFVKYKTPSLER